MREKIVNVSKILVVGTLLSMGNSLYAEDTVFSYNQPAYNMTWVNITILFNNVTLEDLASTYYGDVKDANVIYNANRDIISADKTLYKGMKLKIPVTEKFRDQPEHLGWN